MEKKYNKNKKVDFNRKINEHFLDESIIDENQTKAINEFLVFLIECFNLKNNFHIKNFNKKSLILIRQFYSQIKTNILSEYEYSNYQEFFNNIDKSTINCMFFIINNYLNNVIPSNDHNKRKIFINMITLLNEKKNNN